MSIGGPNYMRNPLDFLTSEQRARHESALRRATEVFGDNIRAYVWLRKYNLALAGGTKLPQDMAAESSEGLLMVHAELARIAPTISPEPPIDLNHRGRPRRRKRGPGG